MSGKAIAFLLLLWWSPAAGDLFPALADSFPDRPIELVIGNQPGGAMDFIAGAFKEKVAAILGQPVLSVFRPGAGTSLAAAYKRVAEENRDGLKKYMNSIEQSLNFLGPEALGKAAGEEYQIYRKLVDDLGMGPK